MYCGTENGVLVRIYKKICGGMNMKNLNLFLSACMALTLCSCADSSAVRTETISETLITENTAAVETTALITAASEVSENESVSETVDSEAEKGKFHSPEMDEQYNEKSAELAAFFNMVCDEKDFPAINITTLDEKKILSKEEYVTSVIDVFNCDEKYALSAEGGVKVRGNSTADQGDEKPYRIKFNDKHNMLGFNGGKEFKSWVLLRSYWNLAPDYMAFNLAKEIFDGEYYCSDCKYVNLYLNGEYAGIYLLAEQNQAAKGRVEVTEAKADEAPEDIGYFIELDNYASDEHPYFTVLHNKGEFTDITGETRAFKDKEYSVKSDTTSAEQLEFIEKYTNGVFEILWEAVQNNTPVMFDENYNVVPANGVYSTPREAVEAVIDLDSAVNMLILEELVHNYDVGAGSFYMAVDFGKKSKYERLTFTAPWDFNWAYYEETDGRYYAGAFQREMDDDRTNPWFTVLMKADWFRETVKEKWAELAENGLLENVTKQVSEDLRLLENDLGENAWRIDSAMQIVDFVNGRIKWLDTVWSKK